MYYLGAHSSYDHEALANFYYRVAPTLALGVRQNFRGDYTQNSHELRLATNGDGPFSAQAGLYYFREASSQIYTFRDLQALGLPPYYVFPHGPTVATSEAIFGQATYRLTDKLRATAGARYTEDRKSRVGSTNFQQGAEYDLAPATLLYASLATGYISKPFNETVVMARVAMHLQMVRQRRMLQHLAHVDGLTELANRRRFDEVYEAEWQRSRRSGRPLSLALLDIDAFKQYNDHYGHPAGDRALRAVARTAASGLRRPSDLAARYGGEEMVLLLPDTEAAQAQQVVSCICGAIADLLIPHEASSVAPMLTVSAGGATLNGAANETGSELFAAADALLYRAKKAGRNRVEWRIAT